MSLLAVVTQVLVLLSIIASVFILFRLLTPQFVTLRALGAPRSFIFCFAWGFTAVLILVGIVVGLLGGFLLSFGISGWLANTTGVTLEPVMGREEGLMAASVLFAGLALATLPAWKLQHLSLGGAMKEY